MGAIQSDVEDQNVHGWVIPLAVEMDLFSCRRGLGRAARASPRLQILRFGQFLHHFEPHPIRMATKIMSNRPVARIQTGNAATFSGVTGYPIQVRQGHQKNEGDGDFRVRDVPLIVAPKTHRN
jgi:hypothetical protein